MQKNKKLIGMLIILLCLLSTLALSSCSEENGGNENGNGGGEPQATSFDYSITLKDAFGAPVSNMIIKLMSGTETAAMKLADSDGKASGTLDNGTYAIEIISPKGDPFYYGTSITLSENTPEVEIGIYNTTAGAPTHELVFGFDAGIEGAIAPILTKGAYRVEFSDGKAYFIFSPELRGKYRISAKGAQDLSIAYNGGPYYVQQDDISDESTDSDVYKTGEGLFLNIRNHHLGEDIQSASKFVVSVTSETAEGCIVVIERIDDLDYSIDELPWEEVKLPVKPETYSVPYITDADNFSLLDVDITDPDTVAVYNETDGFYHFGTEDGPVILLRLTTSSKYAISLKEISEMNRIGAYIYDENGEFVSKTSYHTMLLDYIAAVDESFGVYPMTQYLRDAITNYGAANDWWNKSVDNRFFGDAAMQLVMENAWLFACCYAVPYDMGTVDAPVEVAASGKLAISGSEPIYLANKTTNVCKITITDTEGSLKAVYLGNEYVADGGVITLTVNAGESFTVSALSGAGELCFEYTSQPES